MASAQSSGFASSSAKPATIDSLRREVARLLEGSTPSARLDARLLVACAAGVSANDVALHGDRLLPAGAGERALDLVRRRIAGEPVARIVGEKEFWGLTFRLSRETLVPRPDTETVVSAALGAVGGWKNRLLRVLDLGTGSGAILLALLSELPDAFGVGTDRSEGALFTARENAGRLGLAGRVAFAGASWAAPIAARFDLIVSNPPYIAAREIDALPIEVKGFDPHLSLDGGSDGLAAYREIIPQLHDCLGRGGLAFLEVGQGQAAAVAAMGEATGFASGRHRDLAGVERVIEFRRAEAD